MIATATATEIKERPIIFSGPMVKQILAGAKSQTRRVIKPQPTDSWMREEVTDWSEYYKRTRFGLKKHLWICHPTENKEIDCPYGKPGDRLWVREALKWSDRIAYNADGCAVPAERIPVDFTRTIRDFITSQFMPRWASRITLEITNIRVERLQEISKADAIAEGAEPFMGKDATAWRAGFQIGWDAINSKRGYSWPSNPWVWAISFRKL